MNYLRVFIVSILCVITASANENAGGARTFAKSVVELIAKKKWDEFSKLIHPNEGVKFAPNVYLEKTAVTLKSEQFLKLIKNKKKKSWGEYEVTGDPIHLTFNGYYKEFLYKRPYATVKAGKLNDGQRSLGLGNNILDVFPGEDVITVEFYIPSSDLILPNFGGLNVILKKDETQLYVIGLVNSYWSP